MTGDTGDPLDIKHAEEGSGEDAVKTLQHVADMLELLAWEAGQALTRSAP
ncbi:hypothetical protein [Xanthobacter sediminis]